MLPLSSLGHVAKPESPLTGHSVVVVASVAHRSANYSILALLSGKLEHLELVGLMKGQQLLYYCSLQPTTQALHKYKIL